jgi:hypothetical protein
VIWSGREKKENEKEKEKERWGAAAPRMTAVRPGSHSYDSAPTRGHEENLGFLSPMKYHVM